METLELRLITIEAALKGGGGAEPGRPAALSTKNVHFKNQREEKATQRSGVRDKRHHSPKDTRPIQACF